MVKTNGKCAFFGNTDNAQKHVNFNIYQFLFQELAWYPWLTKQGKRMAFLHQIFVTGIGKAETYKPSGNQMLFQNWVCSPILTMVA